MGGRESTESDSTSVGTDVESTASISWGPIRFARVQSVVLVGVLVVTVGLWWLDFEIPPAVIWALPLVLAVTLSVAKSVHGLEYMVDPKQNTVSTHIPYGDRTMEQQLTWAVRVRRVDLGIVSLFLFSNRGKRWYEGPHVLPVPTELADTVESTLRGMVDSQDHPPRIRSDERLIVLGVGLSLIGVGPFLYLLSGELGLLLVTSPSAFIAPGLLVHSLVG